ncbi:hypothetical protein PYCCODRAFT_1471996 [Trametes coccinea BRFM310]|uniref:Uncharacterized protein n=1 Tax=Trametes coccinea (strain BRFM310) TaxID=1353009 RepID=A0A1Y2I7S0_TRAC3|nr:hypothetical protein PYCCODRAFT_1471996 [Trametes coccinea BRFM310]
MPVTTRGAVSASNVSSSASSGSPSCTDTSLPSSVAHSPSRSQSLTSSTSETPSTLSSPPSSILSSPPSSIRSLSESPSTPARSIHIKPQSPPSPSSAVNAQVSRTSQLPGAALIVGAAILRSPRVPDPTKPRTLAFDAQFWLGDDHIPATACLRYFNSSLLSFDENRNVCVILATVAQSSSKANTFNGMTWMDYNLLGDIAWLLPCPTADPRIHPMMIVSGPVSAIDRTALQFKLSATQYVQHLSSLGDINVSVTIPDSGRYRNSKPLPFSEGANATVVGHLQDVTRTSDGTSADTVIPEAFQLTLENVVYFPRSTNYKTPLNSQANPTSSSKRAWRFTFDPDGTSPDKGKKRAREDDDADLK